MKRILVTGGAGFIGSKVSDNLVNDGYEVFTIDNLSTGYEENLPSRVKFIEGDCSDNQLTDQLLKYQFDSIIHIAGQSSGEISFEDPERDLRDNALSTLNLLNFATKNNCKKLYMQALCQCMEMYQIILLMNQMRPNHYQCMLLES